MLEWIFSKLRFDETIEPEVIGYCERCGVPFLPGSEGECFTVCDACWNIIYGEEDEEDL